MKSIIIETLVLLVRFCCNPSIVFKPNEHIFASLGGRCCDKNKAVLKWSVKLAIKSG